MTDDDKDKGFFEGLGDGLFGKDDDKADDAAGTKAADSPPQEGAQPDVPGGGGDAGGAGSAGETPAGGGEPATGGAAPGDATGSESSAQSTAGGAPGDAGAA